MNFIGNIYGYNADKGMLQNCKVIELGLRIRIMFSEIL